MVLNRKDFYWVEGVIVGTVVGVLIGLFVIKALA